ncbi:MAG TPA: cytochrome ubiquinol oxidase subunit I [Elusimicrobiota bacterium]|nr:cytochrome ubiquinol oxidase subunit I [Elusimicrobiota bacterium]
MHLNVVALSRLQFALTIMFHYLFPPLSIGLGALMVIMEGAYHWTGDKEWETLARFWTKIFAVNFAMGVASGIVMEFEFGTNWATYSRFVGDIFGSALAAEGIFAFFLESGFLSVLVFGWDRVSKRMHFVSTCLVALGALFSAVWIIVANSWQQTPAGYVLVTHNGMTRAEVANFWAVVFNPSSMQRLVHTVLGAYMMGAAFVASVSAYYVLKGRHGSLARKSLALSVIFGAIAAFALPISGDSQAREVARYQPAKLAAFEGLYKTTADAPLTLFGIPDDARQELRAAVGVPGLLSFLVHGRTSAAVTGLDAFAPDDRPPTVACYILFHAMVIMGLALAALFGFSLWRLRGGKLYEDKLLLKGLIGSVVATMLANEIGWCAAEVGRQPWIVYGLLRTKDAVSRAVPAQDVLISIVLFSIIYVMLAAIWLYILDEKIRHGPDEATEAEEHPHGWIEAAARLASPAGGSMAEGEDRA